MSSMILDIVNGTKEEIVQIDKTDYELVKGYRWKIQRQKRDRYVKKYIYCGVYENDDWRKPYTIYLHRLIMKPDKNLQVDHINGDGLDNRRKNLRVVTKSQNALNRNFGRSSFGKHKYPMTS